MTKLEGAVTEKKMVSKQKKKNCACYVRRHPLFIYFDKQSFALIIHANACSERSVPHVSWQPGSVLGALGD